MRLHYSLILIRIHVINTANQWRHQTIIKIFVFAFFALCFCRTGFILSGNEISQIMLSMLLTYFGGQRNRPRWIAWGVVFSAMSCFILAWPHFIYGAGEEALQYTKEYVSKNQVTFLSNPSSSLRKIGYCYVFFSQIEYIIDS